MRSDEDEIHAVVTEYVEGMVGADPEKMRRAFHSKACIIGNFQGEMEWSALEDFIAAVVAEGASSAPPQWTLHRIDVEGDAGSAKLEDSFAGMRFVDYLSLLKTPTAGRSSTSSTTTPSDTRAVGQAMRGAPRESLYIGAAVPTSRAVINGNCPCSAASLER